MAGGGGFPRALTVCVGRGGKGQGLLWGKERGGLRQRNGDIDIADGEEASLAMNCPLEPVIINLLCQCDGVSLLQQSVT